MHCNSSPGNSKMDTHIQSKRGKGMDTLYICIFLATKGLKNSHVHVVQTSWIVWGIVMSSNIAGHVSKYNSKNMTFNKEVKNLKYGNVPIKTAIWNNVYPKWLWYSVAVDEDCVFRE